MKCLRNLVVLVSALGTAAHWNGLKLEPAEDIKASLSLYKESHNDTQIKHVIVSTQRSGSTWLRSMLRSHPEIENDGEYCGTKRVQKVANYKVPSATVERVVNASSTMEEFDHFYKKHYEDVLDFAFQPTKDQSLRSIGFKWMLNQGLADNLHAAIKYFNKNHIKVLILDRQNALRRSISTYHMHCSLESAHIHTNHHQAKQAVVTSEPADIPISYLKTSIQNHIREEEIFAEIEKKANEVLRVPYEALAAEPDAWMIKVYDFLGVKQWEAETGDMQKIHDGTLDTLIKDWSDKKKVLMEDPKIAAKIIEWEGDNMSNLFSVDEEVDVPEIGSSLIQRSEFPKWCTE